ncbi:MAG: ATP-binding cassette domain-containing protein [Propionibacteriaceae bacterium]|nr:ATP-binding cassette domain-containing protein [Propionibacteriaceae bacterium]
MTSPGGLEASGLTWQPLGAAAPVLNAVDLIISPGERVLVAGVSGAGKSTLLRAFAGVLEEHSPGELTGSVQVGGTPAGSGRPDVGLVQQQPFDSIITATVGRDVAFGPENLGVTPEEIRARVEQALDLVGFPYGEQHDTGMLSGGQAQRLALAGVLALRPDVLLLDEPVAMLDAPAAREVRDAVGRVVERSRASLVVVDHDIEGWVGIVQRLVVLDQGRVRFDGPLTEILAAHGAELVQLGLWVPGAAPPIPQQPQLDRPKEPRALQARGLRVSRRAALSLHATPRPERLVLDGVDLQLNPGELVALRGASGSGKSTLVATLLGLLPVTSGEVRLEGVAGQPRQWSSIELASRMGWVPQFTEALAVGETVLESLLATVDALGRPRQETQPQARALLAALGIEELAERHPLSLSGGEQRRLAVACALLHAPAVMALDEPTVGLDRYSWAAVAGLIQAASRNGTGVLVATHDEGLTRLADREHHLREVPTPEAVAVTPPPGLLGRAGPLSLLAGVGLVTVSGLAASGLVPLLVACVVMVVMGAAMTGFRLRLIRLLPALIAVLSVAWSNWVLASPPSLLPAAQAALRVALIVVPGVVAAGCLDPTVLGDHLGRRLKLPARPVLAMTAALRRLGEFAALWQELAQARRVRGLGPGRGLLSRGRYWAALCFALLAEALRRAGRLTVAMDSRGYSAPGPRTWLGEAPWTRSDTAVVLCALVIAVTPHLVRAFG